MSKLSPIDRLEALVGEIETAMKLSPVRREHELATLIEWKHLPEVAKDAIAFHRGHVTETTRFLHLVVRLQKAFYEAYFAQSPRNREWFDGTFPRFRPILNELVAYVNLQEANFGA